MRCESISRILFVVQNCAFVGRRDILWGMQRRWSKRAMGTRCFGQHNDRWKMGSFIMQFRILKGHVRPVSVIAMAIALSTAVPALAQTVEAQPVTETTKPEADTNGWGIATNDLTPDSAVRYGVLPNGMKYALRRNETPKGAASMRLTIDAGRMAEIEGEQGVAHFLEHMAFRGSTNIPDGELLKKLERLGLAFGPDTNAETSADYTRYKLDLPRTDDEMIDAALMIMRETASELALSKDAIDKERGVILAEAPTRDNPNIRNSQAYFRASAPDSRIGYGAFTDNQDDVKNAAPETVRAFYQRNYRPEKATLVLVGDFDVDAIEKKIFRQFSDWRGKGAAGGNDFGKVDAEKPLGFGNFANANVSEAITLARIAPFQPSENTIADAKRTVLNLLWQVALSKRLDSLSRTKDARIAGGSALQTPQARAIENLAFTIISKEGDWQGALQTAEQEYRRMMDHGLGQDEVDAAFQQLGGFFQSLAQNEGSRTSDTIATELSDDGLNDTFAVLPSKYLEIFNSLNGKVTPEMATAAFKATWGNGPNYIHIQSKVPVDDFATIAAAEMEGSRAIAVAALTQAKAVPFAYTDFGKAGKIVRDTRNATLDMRTLIFKNGVMLNIKKTDFEPGNVHFAVRIGSGLAGQNTMVAGLPYFMDQTSAGDGLQAHSFEELQRIIAGRKVKLGLSARQRDVASVGSVAPQDLAFQMQLIAATVTAYGYRAETNQSWKASAPVFEGQFSATPMGIFQAKFNSIVAGDDQRIGIADIDGLSERNMAELKAWLQPELDSGPIEISLVGDIDEAAAITHIANTFGALPKRGKAKPAVSVSFPKSLTPRIISHKGKDDQAIFVLSWPGTDDSDQRSVAARDLLAGVMQNEMRAVLRDKLGATYTPEAFSVPSSAFPGFGLLAALVTTTPENMGVVKSELLSIVKRLRDEGTSEDALLRVRQPILERFAAQERSNSSWLTAISDAQSRPERLGRRAKRTEIWSSITPADVQKAAQEYLIDDRALEIRIVSEAVAAGGTK
jgi:zinc protease